MPGISNAQLLDLTATTQKNLPNLQFEVALKNQQYNVINRWFAADRVQIESGTQIERNIILDPQGNAKHVRLFQKTAHAVPDLHKKITAPWVQVQTSWSIERREALRNRRPAMYISLLQSRRVAAVIELANLLEERAWKAPQNTTDDLNPRGLPFWLSQNTNLGTLSTGAFDGVTIRYGDGTTATDKGGIDGAAAGNENWRNWTAVQKELIPATPVSLDIPNSFVQNFRKAFHATNFKGPMTAEGMFTGPSSNFRIYMPLGILVEFEELATRANENIGRDLDPFHNVTTFKRVPVFYENQLDGLNAGLDTTNTHGHIYAVNHANFFPITLEGDWMRMGDPMTDVEQSNVMTTQIDGSYQYFCKNVREAGFVFTINFAATP